MDTAVSFLYHKMHLYVKNNNRLFIQRGGVTLSNICWYVSLGILGISGAVFTIYKKRHIYKTSTLVTFYMAVSGFAWICEFAVLGLFNSYSYKTGVLQNIWAQNLLGHLILNTTLYPAAAIITVTNRRRKIALLFFIVFFSSAEYLFVKLGLYTHNWWRYYMTVVTVILSLSIEIKWFDKIKHGCQGLTRAFTFFFVALLILHFPAPILLLLGKQYYQLKIINNFFGDLYLSSIIIIFSYHLLESIELVLIACVLKKKFLKALPFIISITFQLIFLRLNVLILDNTWNILYSLILYEAFIGAFLLVEKYTLKPAAEFKAK